jgi:hypothetical protein
MSSLSIEFINDMQHQELTLINPSLCGKSAQFLPERLFALKWIAGRYISSELDCRTLQQDMLHEEYAVIFREFTRRSVKLVCYSDIALKFVMKRSCDLLSTAIYIVAWQFGF